MPLPVAPLALVTLTAGAAIGATSYFRTKRAQKRGDTSAFADSETDPVGIKMQSPYADEANRPGTEAERQDPPEAPKSPGSKASAVKTASAETSKTKPRAPKVAEPA